MPQHEHQHAPQNKSCMVRIIGGAWRSRRLRFPKNTPVRPTLDRIRETAFNWLQPYLADARCLDVFAGSGAFGFEALSRGAVHTCFVEKHGGLCDALHQHAAMLDAQSRVTVWHQAASPEWTPREGPFDVVFLDPPYRKALLLPMLDRLAASGALAEDAVVYVEFEKEWDLKAALQGRPWLLLKHKQTRSLAYALLAFNEA